MIRNLLNSKKSISYSHAYKCRVYGVDFSGAANAGKKIWITSGIIKCGVLLIKECQQAGVFLASGTERNKCMAALRNFVAKERTGAFGFDFPFGLPGNLIKEHSWKDFILSFPYHYSNPEEFRKFLFSTSGRSELKRITDKESQTPFSPYNLRLYRQTFFGIREILFPLIQNRSVCVLPMQKAQPNKTWLLEVCPASTLKHEHLYFPYKGRTKTHYATRKRILKWIEEKCILPRTIQSTVLEDYCGDALDSIIAALVTFRTLCTRTVLTVTDNDAYQLEGYVYI